MLGLKDMLMSRGKAGAVALIIIGGYMVAEIVIGGGQGDMQVGVAMIMAGISLFGIRAKLPPSE
jgi:hypothetical protein